jgi:hypothetical protein
MFRIRISMVGLGIALGLAVVAQTTGQPAPAAGVASQPAVAGAGRQPEAKPQTPPERESARLLSISEWAKKTGASREQVQERVFAPIIAGNQSDAEKNNDAALSIGQKAGEAAKAGDLQGAKKLRTLAELFAECAKDNRHFLQTYKNGDMKGAKEALTRLRAYDDRIAEIAGQRVPRSWYAHELMVATMGLTGDEIKRGFEQQFLGRTLPTATAAAAPRTQK